MFTYLIIDNNTKDFSNQWLYDCIPMIVLLYGISAQVAIYNG